MVRVEQIQSLVGAHPEPAIGIDQDGSHLIVGEASGCVGVVAEMLEATLDRVDKSRIMLKRETFADMSIAFIGWTGMNNSRNKTPR
jgi:hypothetical protein